MDFLKPCWKQDWTEHRFHIKYWSHNSVPQSFTIFNQPKAHVVIFLLWFDKQANIKAEVLLIVPDELSVLHATGGKGGQKKNEKLEWWGTASTVYCDGCSKENPGSSWNCSWCVLPRNKSRALSCCHLHKIGDKVNYEEPQSHQPPVQSPECGFHQSKWPNILMGFSQPEEPVHSQSGSAVTFMWGVK